MNELEIIRNDIDWLKVIELALKKKDWGKTFVLYRQGSLLVNCVMDTFVFSKNKAVFKIYVEYDYSKHSEVQSYWGYKYVDYFIDNFTVQEFKRIVNKNVLTILKDVQERHSVKEAQEKFEYLKHYSWDIDLEAECLKIHMTEDYESIGDLNNKDLRDLCYSTLTDKIVDTLNEEYEAEVHRYKISNSVNIPYMQELTQDLEKELL